MHLLPGLQPLGCLPPAVRAAASHSLSEAVKVSCGPLHLRRDWLNGWARPQRGEEVEVQSWRH